MDKVSRILIVGGGTAGWLTAAIVAAYHRSEDGSGPKVTLVEAADIPTIGVGEGTWPTMKNTMKDIGIKERELFRHCHAGFKQGGKFVDWVHGNGDFYYHPFTVPLGYGRLDLAPYIDDIAAYAPTSNFQQHVCEAGLAPRSLAEDEYTGQCNYAYHVDAGKLGDLLKNHCRDNLGVEHLIDTVESATLDADGAIASLHMAERGEYTADLYIDCTGFASRLLGDALQVPMTSMDEVLFNDSALAVQVPYPNDDSPVACHTIATAQDGGWIWDIGLTHRRGIGHVYSSRHISHERAEENLARYIGPQIESLSVRRIGFGSGYRAQFWKHNCVAVGLSGGFVEPLEATAIMLVEIAARYIAENLPARADVMPLTADRFNEQMHYRWRRIIDFLKLHYTLTRRTEPYWRDHQDPATVPDSLKADLALWGSRGPVRGDFERAIELFPAASYQYVMYGMGFRPDFDAQGWLHRDKSQAMRILERNQQITQQMLRTLPSHRDYIDRWLATTG